MGIPINDGFGVAAPRYIDLRSGKIVLGKSVPYDSTAEALAAVISTRRCEGLIVFVKTGGVINEYWFVGGIADVNLVLKGVATSQIATASPTTTPAGRITTVLRIITPSLQTIRVGTTPGGDEVMEDRAINGAHLHGCLVDGGVTLYVTGTFTSIELKFL